jgi:glutaconate CoA-transferase subunit A
VVEIPGGAHPSSCSPQYGFDVPHFKAYTATAKEGGIEAYMEQFVGASEEEYQQNVGGLAAIKSIELPTY